MESSNGILEQSLLPAKLPERIAANAASARAELAELAARLDLKFTLVDGGSGELLDRKPAAPGGDWMIRGALCREVASRGQAMIIEDHDLLVVLAAPVVDLARGPHGSGFAPVHVAVTQFLTRPANRAEDHQQLAAALGISVDDARNWAEKQAVHDADDLLLKAQLVCDKLAAERRCELLQGELDDVAENLSSSYEELSLLYRVTENLRLSGGAEQISRLAMQWLTDVIPAKGFAILLDASASAGAAPAGDGRGPLLLTEGESRLTRQQFQQLAAEVVPRDRGQPFVANRVATSACPERYYGLESCVIVPVSAGEKRFGWLAALDHAEGAEFGTIEASLLNSVATILGIHAGNVELYRGQTELLAGVVRALSSAIDAKDPYTRGHSDRVARVAVRLTKQLGHSLEFQQTVYLSGLLHDIGKIGIEDEVLRKPGRLTDAEYEHIKLHPEIGYKILVGLKKFDNVLPGVLHHHEAWDGRGYPHGLKGEEIPLMARIIAVADSFDAMGSDRPYRKGMPEEKLDAILREGAGSQWDADVIEAFFTVREDIRQIAKRDRDAYPLDLAQWALANG